MWKLIVVLLSFCAAPFFYVMDGTILRDVSLKSETLVPALLPTEDRECRSTAMVFHQCSYKYAEGQDTKRQNYYFLSFGAPETLILLRSAETNRITSDVGQDYLTNRVVTLFLFPLFGLLMLLRRRQKAPASASAGYEAMSLKTNHNPASPVSSTSPVQKGFGRRR